MSVPDGVPGLRAALADAGVEDGTPEDGLVWGPLDDRPDGWEEVEGALVACFEVTRLAAAAGARVVYLVHEPALLGRSTPAAGMLAAALVSGARAYAVERRRHGGTAGVVTYDAATRVDVLARWAHGLLEPGTPGGALLHLGVDHHGTVPQ